MRADETDPKRARHNLGRGLAALFGEQGGDYTEADQQRQSMTVPVEFLRPSRFQPRHSFDEERLGPLVESVREKGVLQPILVRRHGREPETYEIVAGERRWRAAQLAGLDTIPSIIREIPDQAALVVALIENIQREDLNPMEEARALQRLVENFEMTHATVADAVGRSRVMVSNLLRLLELPAAVMTMLERRELDMGHARALLAVDSAADQLTLARRVVKEGWSVRETERAVRRLPESRKRSSRAGRRATRDPDVRRLETNLADRLGAKVRIEHSGSGGRIIIRYFSLDELEGIVGHID